MKYEWLNKSGNKDLIVFFNGWGMDSDVVSHINFGNFDILMFYDYRAFEPINFDFSKYEKKYLIAWSMGVLVCNKYYETFKNFDKFIAINGTHKPIDDNFGIPELIYNLTIENFNELSCLKFVSKMSNNNQSDEHINRPIDELKDELIKIRDIKPDKFLTFNKAIVGLKDRIIPSKNQINWWESQNVPMEKIEKAPHYIFDLYKNWSDLL